MFFIRHTIASFSKLGMILGLALFLPRLTVLAFADTGYGNFWK